MTRRRFSQTEVEYLRSLPAVEAVTENHITYSHDFQVSCMSSYLQQPGAMAMMPTDARNRLITMQMGQIQSLTCQVIALRQRVGELEQRFETIES